MREGYNLKQKEGKIRGKGQGFGIFNPGEGQIKSLSRRIKKGKQIKVKERKRERPLSRHCSFPPLPRLQVCVCVNVLYVCTRELHQSVGFGVRPSILLLQSSQAGRAAL